MKPTIEAFLIAPNSGEAFEALGLCEIVDLICSYVNPFLVRM